MSRNCLVYLDDDHVSARTGSLIPHSDLSSADLVQNKSTSC